MSHPEQPAEETITPGGRQAREVLAELAGGGVVKGVAMTSEEVLNATALSFSCRCGYPRYPRPARQKYTGTYRLGRRFSIGAD